MFFLVLAIVQFFPAFQTLDPIVAALPFILVLLATILKEGFEDFKRHRSDSQINQKTCLTISNFLNVNRALGKKKSNIRDRFRNFFDPRHGRIAPIDSSWSPIAWKKIAVGDFVLLRENDQIPADIMVVSTSEKEGVCFLQTKNLDGETNLKICRAPEETMDITSISEIDRLCAILECDAPQPHLYSFTGSLKIVAAKQLSISDAVIPEDIEKSILSQVPLSVNNIMLRGCILRNTEWVIGLVVFTGRDTKIHLNSGATPHKRSRLEIEMNFYV